MLDSSWCMKNLLNLKSLGFGIMLPRYVYLRCVNSSQVWFSLLYRVSLSSKLAFLMLFLSLDNSLLVSKIRVHQPPQQGSSLFWQLHHKTTYLLNVWFVPYWSNICWGLTFCWKFLHARPLLSFSFLIFFLIPY